MKKSFLTILQYLFFFAIGILFVWLSIKDIKEEHWLQIQDSIRRARHWLIIPVIVMLLASHYSRAIRWKLLMDPLGFQPSTFNTFAAVMIGYLVNTGVPRLGEVVKCTLLSRYEKVRADKLIGTIVVERAIDVVCLLIVFLAAILLQWHIVGDFIVNIFNRNGSTDRPSSMIKLAFIVAGIILFCFALYYFLKRFSHINIIAKAKDALKGIVHGLNSIRLVRNKGQFIFHTIFIWVMYLMSTTLGIYALQETAHLGINGGLTTLAIGSVGMIITPGGIGAYAYLVAKLMQLYGLNEETIGNALGWLLWSVQTIIILAGGLIFFVLFSFYNKKRVSIANRKDDNQ